MTEPDHDRLADLLADREAGRPARAGLDASIQEAVDTAIALDRELAALGLAYHGHPNAVGRWRLLRPLGRGTAGVVYAAEHEGTGQRAAVRLVTDPAEPWLRAAAERVIDWRHPAIAAVIEVGHGWIASELVEGTSLAALIGRMRREPPLDREAYVRPLLRAMAPVVAALRAARADQIHHGGIRPSKLATDESGRLRLRDFGFDPTRAFRPPLSTRPPLGSPLHLAPEQTGGPGDVGPHTDLYSLCAVLYTIAAGTPPFVARSLPDLLHAIRSLPPPPLADRAPWLAEEVRVRIETGLAKRPEDRIVGLNRLAERLRES